MLRLAGAVSILVCLVLAFAGGWIVAMSSIGQAVDPESLTDRERKFSERMQGVTLIGSFTIEGREAAQRHPERYEIASVTKVGDDMWRFDARIVYGRTDVTLPVTLPIVWAGDTPVISITDFAIPTLGTFTVRLLFYDDRYAGSWQHDDVGGLMFGTIER